MLAEDPRVESLWAFRELQGIPWELNSFKQLDQGYSRNETSQPLGVPDLHTLGKKKDFLFLFSYKFSSHKLSNTANVEAARISEFFLDVI